MTCWHEHGIPPKQVLNPVYLLKLGVQVANFIYSVTDLHFGCRLSKIFVKNISYVTSACEIFKTVFKLCMTQDVL